MQTNSKPRCALSSRNTYSELSALVVIQTKYWKNKNMKQPFQEQITWDFNQVFFLCVAISSRIHTTTVYLGSPWVTPCAATTILSYINLNTEKWDQNCQQDSRRLKNNYGNMHRTYKQGRSMCAVEWGKDWIKFSSVHKQIDCFF